MSFDPDTAEVTMPYSAHAVWKHEIDSKGPGISDEGDMFLLANGDCIEVGMMENPRTGKIEMYKEYWTTPPTEPGSGELRRTPCVVARTQEATETTSGVIIRVGDYCQGIARHAETGVLVERWQRLAVEANPALGVGTGQESSTEWLEDWRSNTAEHNKIEGLLPCMWTCREDRKLGDEIVVHGVRWKIVEAVV